MGRIYYILVFALVLATVGSGVSHAYNSDWKDDVKKGTYIVDDSCTGYVAKKSYIITASHCVGLVGDYIQVSSMLTREKFTGRVVYDDPKRDMAAIMVPALGGYWRSPCPSTRVFDVLWSYNYSLGLSGWESYLEYRGKYYSTTEDQDIVVMEGKAYPGASGSIVWDDYYGCPVGMITKGVFSGAVPTLIGPAADEVEKKLLDRLVGLPVSGI